MKHLGPHASQDGEVASTVDSLRQSALAALGAWADPRAQRALAHGELVIERDVAGWEGSAGRIRGHRVTLLLDSQRFAEVRDAHALIDALCGAVAIAVSSAPGDALADFVVRGSSTEIERRSPYRSPP
jgi:hypothetical protein